MSVEFNGDHKTAYEDDVISGHPLFGDITGFQIIVSVCLQLLNEIFSAKLNEDVKSLPKKRRL